MTSARKSILHVASLVTCGVLSMRQVGATPPTTPAHDMVFVTQVPAPVEVNSRTAVDSVTTAVSAFGNHLGDTYSAPRGGSLWLRRSANGPNQFVNLLNTATWNLPGGKPDLATVAVRDPSVHWSGGTVLFSMVIGAPSSAGDTTTYFWQLYEVTNLATGQTPVITKVASQPPYNNITPCYGTNGRILFASDRPHNGQANLYPQREEYLLRPTVSGLWSLDPVTADLFLLEHSPSGSFTPFVDSYGRVVFERWDHLSRDPQAVTDRAPDAMHGDTYVQTTNGCGTYLSELSNTFQAGVLDDFFPEPRNFDRSGRFGTNLNGQSFNQFSPWVINENGTDEEFINHAGRHEIGPQIDPSFTDDPNLVVNNPNAAPNLRNYADNFFSITENPLQHGVYLAVNAVDVGYHASGNLISFNGGLSAQGAPVNPEAMQVSYLTPKPTSGTVHLYRNPIALTDGNIVAAHATTTVSNGLPLPDANTGTAAAPVPRYTYRLTTLTGSAPTMAPGNLLTSGFSADVTQFANGISVHYNGALWELYPVELVSRSVPASHTNSVTAVESQVFTEEGVNLALFQRDLTQKNAALIISRNMTTRDDADKQQPFNLKVAWSNTQTVIPGPTPGKIYTVGWLQILQGDLRRSFTNGGAQPFPGRRVLATQLHDQLSENPPAEAGQPAGSVKVGNDGSMAAVVPARRALTWHLLDNDAAKTSVVKERYWVSFQPGEVRTCTSCHGLNDKDQAGNAAPQNKPEALRTLLQFWRNNHPYLTWRSQNFIPAVASDDSVAGPNADPDGDGIPNLAEYALGSNPSDPKSQPNISGANVVDPNDGKHYLNLTFHRHLGMVDSTCHVETTNDLVHWQEGGGYTVVGTPVSDGNGTTESVTAKVLAPVESVGKEFIRLRVSQP